MITNANELLVLLVDALIKRKHVLPVFELKLEMWNCSLFKLTTELSRYIEIRYFLSFNILKDIFQDIFLYTIVYELNIHIKTGVNCKNRHNFF